MLAGGKITDVGMPCPINAHTFGVFPVIFVKQGQQCLFPDFITFLKFSHEPAL